jgi:large subunit ribosomal protein L28
MSVFLHRPLPFHPSLSARALSTTLPRPNSLHIEKNDPELVADTVPAYPYGPRQWYKQSDKGLYGTSRIQFGNNVSPKFSTKTRRTWQPNVVRKRLWSHALNRSVQIRVQTRVLRTIDKVGGLDEYLLGEKEGRIKELGLTGWWLRWAIMQTPHIKARRARERVRLGLPREGMERMVEEPQTTLEGEAQVATRGQSDPATIITRRSSTFRQARLIKFRVGRGKHFVFTSKGWRRAQPDKRAQRRRALLLGSPELRSYVDKKMKKLNVEPAQEIHLAPKTESKQAGEPLRLEDTRSVMQEVLRQKKVTLTPEEEKAVRRAVAKAVKAEQKYIVDQKVETPFKLAEQRKIERAEKHVEHLKKQKEEAEKRRELKAKSAVMVESS